MHERDKKGSRDTTQEVELYFNFVGRFVPPAFAEVELTPEELDEIRKREGRKDRLHQNYLKRKASGAQSVTRTKSRRGKRQKPKPKKPPFVGQTLQRARSSLSAVYRKKSQ